MVPLQLNGDTLGLKQKHFNFLVKKKLKEGPVKTKKINQDGNDLENLLTIEVACKTRNLKVILNVLKCEDMLYVSRAIKRSTWLVTDPQYAHIINPEYLHSQLFPHMTVKACNKLLLHIRLHLKDEARVDNFYRYFRNKDHVSALKWLPNCSSDFIQEAVGEQYYSIKNVHLKRLCLKRLREKSISVLETRIQKYRFYKVHALEEMIFLINVYTDKFLDIADTLDSSDIPRFNPKATSVIMKKCPERILINFRRYCDKIDLPTFAKYLKDRDVKYFLLKQAEIDEMQDWFKYDNLKHFMSYIPKNERFDFIRNVFIEKSDTKDVTNDFDLLCQRYTTNVDPFKSANIYPWYRFAPFQLAFPDLKKLIRTESTPSERLAMLAVLLSCANRNQEHINELIQYFHDKHMNEPFNIKLKFVNMLITQTNTWTYDEKTWYNLNTIFHSMEVYTESENNVETCIHCIIVKKVLHNEQVPEIIEKIFLFNTLKKIQKKLSPAENDKIFNYLSNILMNKIKNVVIQSEADFAEVIQLVEKLLTLIMNYKKELADFPYLVAEIRKLAQIKAKNSWKSDMLCLYNKRKSWRRHMFEESLVMCPSEGACLNALKHGPELLRRHEPAVAALRRDDAVSLRRLLAKLRVYWRDSLATQWTDEYLAQLETQGGHKATVRGLCTLLPFKQLMDVIKKYEPNDNKINWNEDNEILLSLRKQIAQTMYIARPAPPLDAILPFARGDYLQFALPSVNAISHNISLMKCREHISKLLQAPVSLQKHGIRLAITKLDFVELQKIFCDIWKSTKNLTIRAVIFQKTNQLLCKESDPSKIEELWKLLEVFIEDLSLEENRTIYNLLAKVDDVPLQVRAKYCEKAYSYLKSLPPKANCKILMKKVFHSTYYLMESLEPNFVINMLQELLEKNITTKRCYGQLRIMSAFLLCTNDTKSQKERYEKLLAPLLESCLCQWNTKVNDEYVVKNNVIHLLELLRIGIQYFVFAKTRAFPVTLFTNILEKLEAKLPMQSNYFLLKSWAMTVNFVKILEVHKEWQSYDEVCLKAAPAFAAYTIQLLKEETTHRFPSIYVFLGKALEYMLRYMEVSQNGLLEINMQILGCEDSVNCHLLVLTALPEYSYYIDIYEIREKLKKIHQIFKYHPSMEVNIHYCVKVESIYWNLSVTRATDTIM